MTTIYECLQNAQYNLVKQTTLAHKEIGRIQLTNAVTLLDKGYPLETEIDPIQEEYSDLELAPDYRAPEKTQEEDNPVADTTEADAPEEKPRNKKGRYEHPKQDTEYTPDSEDQ